MNERRMTPWPPFLRRRIEYCRRLAMMQRNPLIAEALRDLAQVYEAEASLLPLDPMVTVRAS